MEPTEEMRQALLWRENLRKSFGALRAAAPHDDDVAALIASVAEEARAEGYDEARNDAIEALARTPRINWQDPEGDAWRAGFAAADGTIRAMKPGRK